MSYLAIVTLFPPCVKRTIRKLNKAGHISAQGIAVSVSPVSLGKKRQISAAEES